MKTYLFILKFLLLGALFLVSNNQLHLSDAQDRGVFYDLYVEWITRLISQGVDLTGYVVGSDWLPQSAQIDPTTVNG